MSKLPSGVLKEKYEYRHENLLRDSRPMRIRAAEALKYPPMIAGVYISTVACMYAPSLWLVMLSDLMFVVMMFYLWWLMTRMFKLPMRMPKSAKMIDSRFRTPAQTFGMADGILYLGNESETNEEIWFSNNDARTHTLYLGTTGSGKTFGLKSFSCNALCWSSGYIYIDGKADTDLWSTLSAMARRFGRDDDILVMNYMTGNVGGRVPSNTLNPFSSGSPSYLSNMLVSLMPDAGAENAMWKERAVAMIMAIMPCLTWKRDNQNMPLSIGLVRTYLTFKAVVKLSRDSAIPLSIRQAVIGYLNELPGFVDNVFDDEGNEKPMPPDSPPVDTSVPRQQHGYLSMQFTRSMSSLGDDYGFIFDTQAADVDMVDVVLQRRILITLIPALEKSSDETANLGKIIASTLKGMMGATLGSTIEGDTATAIDNKVTTSSTPYMAIFDEVGYYVAQGMAVMAAQARSLGFALVFAAQDLPALEKRVKEEARSITANCNIKLFGRIEDPNQTREFLEKTVGQALVTEVSGFQRNAPGGMGMNYLDTQNASTQIRARAPYEWVKSYNEGKAVVCFGLFLYEMYIYNSDIGHAKAMRVHRFVPIPPPNEDTLNAMENVTVVLQRFRDPNWHPEKTASAPSPDVDSFTRGFTDGRKANADLVTCGVLAVASVAEAHGTIKREEAAQGAAAAPVVAKTASPPLVASPALPAEPVAKGGGPLSWAEVLGAGEAPAAGATAAPAASEAPQAAGGFSWENALGLTPPDAAGLTPPPAAPEIPAAVPPEAPPAAPQPDKNEADGPLAWESIIGTDKKTPEGEENS